MRPCGIFLVISCALSGVAAAWGQPTITEYELPTATSNPTAIAKGPDGNLWFAGREYVEFQGFELYKLRHTCLTPMGTAHGPVDAGIPRRVSTPKI